MEDRTSPLIIGLLILTLFIALHQFTAPTQPSLEPVIPTPALRPVPTLFPTVPPHVIVIERPAEPVPIIIDDHSTNVCIGYCPDAR